MSNIADVTTDRAGHTEADSPGAAVEREAAVMGGLGVEQLDHLVAVTGFFVQVNCASPPVLSESMAIPPLTVAGLLPEGVHECTLDEIRERFGLFQGADRRPVLFNRLIEFLKEARESAMVEAVCVDGSFVTASDVPNDIDLILVVKEDFNLAVDLLPAQYNLISRARVQRRFGFDIVAVRAGNPEVDEAVSFFQQVRGRPHDRKGILRIII